MTVKVSSPHGVDIASALKKFPGIVSKHMQQGMAQAQGVLLKELKSTTSVGVRGELRDSWSAEMAVKDPGVVVGEVGSPVEHAVYVELGTRPHWAPIAPLLDWVMNGPIGEKDETAAFGIAKAVQYKIAEKGTSGQYTLRNAYTSSLDEMTGKIGNALNDALLEIANGR